MIKDEAAIERGARHVRDQPACQPRAGREMEGDVAAIIHIGALQAASRDEMREDMVGHRAGDGRHRRDEALAGEGEAGRTHALGDGPREGDIADLGVQPRQFRA